MVDDSIKNGNFAIRTMDQAMYMNEGARAHTVTVHKVGDAATTTRIDRTLQPDQTYTYTFDAPGTYHVYCRLHGTTTSGMTSTVEVA
ncbi:MAG: plastocyanin/azurin family copper-binding protein [Candidatus Thermoplasmatota archaeon]